MVESAQDALGWFIAEDVPEGRCGFTTDYSMDWEPGNVTCWRSVWEDHDRCIWHADVSEKPSKQLSSARLNIRERLDGAILRETTIVNTISLADCSLFDANLENANFRGVDLSNADLSRAFIYNTDLRKADLRNTTLLVAYVLITNLSDSDISYANFRDADLTGTNLTGANFEGANFIGTDMQNVDFRDTKLANVDFTSAVITEAKFNNVDIYKATFDDADLSRTAFDDSYLYLTSLSEASLNDVDLSNANLRSVDFTDADLSGATLTEAVVRKAVFTGAALVDANLTEADLKGGTFTDADLRGADLTGTGITYSELDKIEIDEGTTFGGRSRWESQADGEAEIAIPYLPWRIPPVRALGRPSTNPSDLVQAELQYRATQRILRENDLQQLPELAVREKHARRKRMLAEWEPRELFENPKDWVSFPARWFTLAGARWITLYGESPWRVVLTSLLVIGAGVAIYGYTGLGDLSLFDRLYFSVSTFTPLMQAEGLPAPETQATKAVAMAQALLGVALTALLIAVLDRRITR